MLSADEVQTELGRLVGWAGDTDGIERSIQAASFLGAIDLVRRVAEVAEDMNHHPDIDIRWRTVRFSVSTHSAGGVTTYDIELANHINRLVDEMAADNS